MRDGAETGRGREKMACQMTRNGVNFLGDTTEIDRAFLDTFMTCQKVLGYTCQTELVAN